MANRPDVWEWPVLWARCLIMVVVSLLTMSSREGRDLLTISDAINTSVRPQIHTTNEVTTGFATDRCSSKWSLLPTH